MSGKTSKSCRLGKWPMSKQEVKRNVHFATLLDMCHLENAELEPKLQKYNGRVVLRGDIVKDDSGAYALFTEQGSFVSQMTAAEVMDVISRLPDCDGQTADAVSACTQVKIEHAPKLLKIPKPECPDIWIRLPRHKWSTSWSNIEDPVDPLERNLYGRSPTCSSLVGKTIRGSSIGTKIEKSTELGMSACSSKTRIILICVCGWLKLSGKKQNLHPMWTIKKSIWENQHLSLIMKTWAALKDHVKWAKILWTITEPCLNHEFPRGELKDDTKMSGRKQNMAPMWKNNDEKTLILTNQLRFQITCLWDAFNVIIFNENR